MGDLEGESEGKDSEGFGFSASLLATTSWVSGWVQSIHIVITVDRFLELTVRWPPGWFLASRSWR